MQCKLEVSGSFAYATQPHRGENFLHASWAVSKHVRTRPFKYYSGTYAWTAVPERRAETTTPVRRRVNCGTRKDSRRRAWRGTYMYMQESMFKTMLRIWRWVRHVCVLLRYMYMQEPMFKNMEEEKSTIFIHDVRSRTTEGLYDTASGSNGYLWRRVRSWTMKDSYDMA